MQKNAGTLRVDFQNFIGIKNHQYFENKILNRTLIIQPIVSTIYRAIIDVGKQKYLTNLTESE